MVMSSRVHLERRDRHAFRFRVGGVTIGAAVIVAAFATSSWDNRWVVGRVLAKVFSGRATSPADTRSQA